MKLPPKRADYYPICVAFSNAVFPEFRDATAKAMKRWNEELGQEVFTFKKSKTTLVVGLMNKQSALNLKGASPYGGVLGVANGGASIKYIKFLDEMPEAYMYPCALHELGHILGLKHTEDRDDIMFHSLVAKELSLSDVVAAKRALQL